MIKFLFVSMSFSLLCIVLSASFSSCERDENSECEEITYYEDVDGDGLGNPDVSITACDQPTGYVSNGSDGDDSIANASPYTGTASVTQGLGSKTTSNLFENGQRIAELGVITSTDNKEWRVPADVNYTDNSFPFAPDLYNPYGDRYTSASSALSAFDENNIVEIDADGEVVTGYIFADNYFELYVNGVKVGKDAIPFTDFNSHIVQFKVTKPFSIAFLLVDWEENLGLGSEVSGGSSYHPGDGGLVAVFKDNSGNTVATTGSEWKAQTFYTSPIQDLSCPSEEGNLRITANCSTADVSDGSKFYGLHWDIPANWMNEDFDDSAWPMATTYTNSTIGVNNKPSYTNFTDVFDDSQDDAEFIWSSNVILDNEVIVRYRVD
ncbi:hypothetical protein [Membranihabitans marinus]|uniref:hypothetical protein n=1 Tax=Membranihabitans marinus TaxID=1227546 RepID=UPI001F1DBEF6|nr:hypothetical protein [Membranihabitans marinus]